MRSAKAPGIRAARPMRLSDDKERRHQERHILAIVLTLVVVAVWEYFIGRPVQLRPGKRRPASSRSRSRCSQQQALAADRHPRPAAGGTASAPASLQGTNETEGRFTPAVPMRWPPAIAVKIDTSRLIGSINLTGASIDDLLLRGYREDVLDPTSPQCRACSRRCGAPIAARRSRHTIVSTTVPCCPRSSAWKTSRVPRPRYW